MKGDAYMPETIDYPDLVIVGAGLFGLTVAQPDTAGKRQKNITELFAGFRKYSIFALAIPKWCVSSAG